MNTTEQFRQLFNQNRELFTQNAIDCIEAHGIIEHCCQGSMLGEWSETPSYILEAIIDLIQTDSKVLKHCQYKIDGWASYLLGNDEDTEQEIFMVTLASDIPYSVDQVTLVQNIKSKYFHAQGLLNSRINSITFMIYR